MFFRSLPEPGHALDPLCLFREGPELLSSGAAWPSFHFYMAVCGERLSLADRETIH